MTAVDSITRVIGERLAQRLDRPDESKAERIERCRVLPEFLRTYLPHYFTDPFGPQQKRLFVIIRDEWGDLKLVIIWPREHGKTTTVSPGLVLHAVAYARTRYTAIICNEDTAARDLLEAIKGEMEENDLLREDFGPFLDLDAPKARTKKLWQQRQIVTLGGIRLRAFGKKAKFRGRKHRQDRPDLIIFDDLQERDECESPEQRDKDHERVLASWVPALAPGGNIIGIGNVVHFDCVIARLAAKGSGWRTVKEKAILRPARRQDLWDEFGQIYGDGQQKQNVRRARAFHAAHQREMDAGARVLWKARMPYRRLMEIQAVIGPRLFETEYQNHAHDPETQPWRREQIQPFNLADVRDVKFRAVMVADPAKQKGYGRNKQAWALIGQDPATGDIYVPAAWKGKRPDSEIVEEWCDAYLSWNAWTPLGVPRFYIETNSAMLLDVLLHDISLRRGVNLPVHPLNAEGEKTNRDSAALDPLLRYRRLWVEESLTWLFDDIERFPHGDLDAIDCLAHGLNCLREAHTVEGGGTGRRRTFARPAVW